VRVKDKFNYRDAVLELLPQDILGLAIFRVNKSFGLDVAIGRDIPSAIEREENRWISRTASTGHKKSTQPVWQCHSSSGGTHDSSIARPNHIKLERVEMRWDPVELIGCAGV